MKNKNSCYIIILNQGGVKMSKYLKNIKKIINNNKKKLVLGISVFVVSVFALGVAGGIFVYSKAKSNINYLVEEAKEIALKVVQGDVVRINKSIEPESLSFEYEFKIKDSNNILREVTVDSNLGVITELDNYYD
mgnify:CR=1 FL=1|jgi:hypothetical protein